MVLGRPGLAGVLVDPVARAGARPVLARSGGGRRSPSRRRPARARAWSAACPSSSRPCRRAARPSRSPAASRRPRASGRSRTPPPCPAGRRPASRGRSTRTGGPATCARRAGAPSPTRSSGRRRASAARTPCCRTTSVARVTETEPRYVVAVRVHLPRGGRRAPRPDGAREGRRGVVGRVRVRCPARSPAASTNVLKVEPACRVDCATRLNWLPFVRTTAVMARIAPVPGSTETIAEAGSVVYGRIVVDRLAWRGTAGAGRSSCRPAARPRAPCSRRTAARAGRSRTRRSTAAGCGCRRCPASGRASGPGARPR